MNAPLSDRALKIHVARVVLAEASRRRHSPVNRDFYWSLLGYAAKCRRVAALMREPTQAGLFS